MMTWQCRDRQLFLERALVMGIVNVTPDSFSDGGAYLDPEAAAMHGEQLVTQGAALLDIGGESTRPGATPITTSEELRRVLPVIERLLSRLDVPLSVDTRNPEVAAEVLGAGAHVINDVGAIRTDPTLWQHVARYGAGYVAMHMQGTPETMHVAPRYRDLVAELRLFFADRLARLAEYGVHASQVAFDPGIGFGKTLEHNLTVLRSQSLFADRGQPIVLGVSRKSFLGKLLGAEVHQRLAGGLACTLWGQRQGVRIFRTHDVFETVQALRMWEELMDPTHRTPCPEIDADQRLTQTA